MGFAMATSYTRTSIVDLDTQKTAAEIASEINDAIEALETAGFVVVSQQIVKIDDAPGVPQVCILTGMLPAYAGDASALGLVQVASLAVGEADITAAAALETLDFASAIAEGSYVLGTQITLTTPFTGGAASDFTLDIGFSGDLDCLVDGADVFAAAVNGQASTRPLGIAPNYFVTGSEAARTPKATFRCGTDDVADVTAGACTINVLYGGAAA